MSTKCNKRRQRDFKSASLKPAPFQFKQAESTETLLKFLSSAVVNFVAYKNKIFKKSYEVVLVLCIAK